MELVYRPPFGLSARKLGAQLGLNTVRESAEPVLAWGVSTAAPNCLNGMAHHNKLQHLRTWESASLSTLEFSTSPSPQWLPRSGNSYGGRDFNRQIRPRYWTKPVTDVDREFRVHLCLKPGGRTGLPSDYRVIRLSYKENVDPSLNIIVQGCQIRSRQFGWRLKSFAQENIQRNLSSKLDLLSRWAIATIGWDFGALDVLRTEDRKFILLEANSAPGLRDDMTCKAYADAIREVLDAG